ncbi:FHA domain-containing protein DDL-like [Anopheles albimanus]|uniref:FHA domain-containing protein DDL-like n=1 Tax=Anopheles albimanus TaxID=7167 RepID=UPI001640C3F4|nr:FHA domain-containing protein DDL-like [Anopheles albimanus]
MSGYRRKHSRHSSSSEEHDDSSDNDDSVRERGERGGERAEKRKSHKKHKKGKKERKDRHARRSEDDASDEGRERRAPAGRSDDDTNHWKSRLPAGSGEGYHRKGRASPNQRAARDESTRHRSPSGTGRRSRDGHRGTRDQQQQRYHQQLDSTSGTSRYSSDDRRERPSARRKEYEPGEHDHRRATGRSDEDATDSANRAGFEARCKRQQHHHNREQSPTESKEVGRQEKKGRPGRYDEIRTDRVARSNLDTDLNGSQNNYRQHNQEKSRSATGSGEGSHPRASSSAHRPRDRYRSPTRRRRSRESSGSGSEPDQHRPRAIKVERQLSSQRTSPPTTINPRPSTSGAAQDGHRKRAPRAAVPKKEDDDSAQYEWGAKRAVKSEPPTADDEPAEVEKQKPNFALSGKLTEEANKVNGVVINYAEPPGACKPKRRWRLYPMKGDQIMPTLYIHRQSCYLIGRDRKVCDLPIDHPSCSKQHAVLQYRLVPHERPDGTTSRTVRPYIIDLDSSNGTFVNYKKIEPKRYLELFEKDVLMFGFSSREYVLLEENSKDDDGVQGEG